MESENKSNNAIWLTLGGTVLGLSYYGLFAKNKSVNNLLISLLVGTGAGLAVGLLVDNIKKDDELTKDEKNKKLFDLLYDVKGNKNADSFVRVYDALQKVNLNEQEYDLFYKYMVAALTAAKEGKVNYQMDDKQKNEVLKAYGLTDEDINGFNSMVTSRLTGVLFGNIIDILGGK